MVSLDICSRKPWVFILAPTKTCFRAIPDLLWTLCRFKQVFSLLLSLQWIRRLGRRLTGPERAANAQRFRRAAAAQYSATLKSNSPSCHSPSLNHPEPLHQLQISINVDCWAILGWCWLQYWFPVAATATKIYQGLKVDIKCFLNVSVLISAHPFPKSFATFPILSSTFKKGQLEDSICRLVIRWCQPFNKITLPGVHLHST